MKRKLSLYPALLICLLGSSPARGDVASLADLLTQCWQQKRPIPVLSQHDPALTVERAYAVQRAYVRRRLASDQIAGFKLGLTSNAAQKRFGLTAPAAGVLLASGRRTGSPTIDRAAFKMLMIETEIGFVVGQRIARPLKDEAALEPRIRAVMPVIELPDLGFQDMKHLKGVDIIAANVSAVQFIIGQERKATGVDLNAVAVALALNAQVVNRGKGADARGDQWHAALWLVNTTVKQGWTIEPGHILITGALGKMMPGHPGEYVADFGDLGQVRFEIAEESTR